MDGDIQLVQVPSFVSTVTQETTTLNEQIPEEDANVTFRQVIIMITSTDPLVNLAEMRITINYALDEKCRDLDRHVKEACGRQDIQLCYIHMGARCSPDILLFDLSRIAERLTNNNALQIQCVINAITSVPEIGEAAVLEPCLTEIEPLVVTGHLPTISNFDDILTDIYFGTNHHYMRPTHCLDRDSHSLIYISLLAVTVANLGILFISPPVYDQWSFFYSPYHVAWFCINFLWLCWFYSVLIAICKFMKDCG